MLSLQVLTQLSAVSDTYSLYHREETTASQNALLGLTASEISLYCHNIQLSLFNHHIIMRMPFKGPEIKKMDGWIRQTGK